MNKLADIETQVGSILDGLAREHGHDAFVSAGYIYYKDALEAFTDLIRSRETLLLEQNPSPTSGGGLTVQANEEQKLVREWFGDKFQFLYENDTLMIYEIEEVVVEAVEKFSKPSPSDSPKGLGVQPDIKENENLKTLVRHYEAVLTVIEGKPVWSGAIMRGMASWALSHGKELNRDLAVNLTDEGEIDKCRNHYANQNARLLTESVARNRKLEERIEALEKENSSLKVANSAHANSVLSIHSEELSELKAEVTRLREGLGQLKTHYADLSDNAVVYIDELLAPKKEGV